MKVVAVTQGKEELFHAMEPGNIFSSAKWCACYPSRLKKFFIMDDGDKPIGGFVAYEGGRRRIKTLITPPFAPHIGLFALENKNNPVKVNSFRKEIIDAIADFLLSSGYSWYKLDFAPEWHDMQPMLWKKIHATVRYTYRMDLHRSTVEINANLDSSKRNKINKAERDGFTVSHVTDAALVFNMVSENLHSNDIAVHPGIMRNILDFASYQGDGIYSIVRHNDAAVAVNVCITDAHIAFNLLSAIDRKSKQSHGGTFSLYHSILLAKEKGLRIFDFEGSGVPEIEEFFRSFGGDLIPYFSVSGGKGIWPWVMKWRHGG